MKLRLSIIGILFLLISTAAVAQNNTNIPSHEKPEVVLIDSLKSLINDFSKLDARLADQTSALENSVEVATAGISKMVRDASTKIGKMVDSASTVIDNKVQNASDAKDEL